MTSNGEPFSQDPHYAAVGRVASLWATFELDLDMAAITLTRAALLGGLCLTSQIMGAPRKLDAYMALAELRANKSPEWKSLQKDLNDFAKDTQSLTERRNRTVHDPWYVSKEETRRLEITARRKLRFLRVSTTSTQMDELIYDMTQHGKRFGALRERVTRAAARS
jgi:hypothetical protein